MVNTMILTDHSLRIMQSQCYSVVCADITKCQCEQYSHATGCRIVTGNFEQSDYLIVAVITCHIVSKETWWY